MAEHLVPFPGDDGFEGHTAAVELMEEWLRKVQMDRGYDFCAIVLCRGAQTYEATFSGSAGPEFAALAGLDDLREGIRQALRNRPRAGID